MDKKKKVMLGKLQKEIPKLSLSTIRVLYDLVTKLLGKSGPKWLIKIKRLLRGDELQSDTLKDVLRLISSGKKLFVLDGPETKRIKTLKDMEVCFANINSGLKNLGTSQSQEGSAKKTLVKVYELNMDAAPYQMFDSLSDDVQKLRFEPGQIIDFIIRYPDWLRKCGHMTFFLFELGENEEEKEQFFACVYFDSDGKNICVDFGRLDDDLRIWSAIYSHRVVVPETATVA
jgi:hypothetical protein